MRNPTACMRWWQYPGAAEALSLRPVRVLFYGAYVSRRVFSPGRPHYCCIDAESNRGDGFNVSHKSLRVSSRCPQDPSRSASQATRMAQKCVWAPNSTGVLDDSPRALGDCRGPSKKKVPVSYAVSTRQHVHMAQGLDQQPEWGRQSGFVSRETCSHACEPKAVTYYPGWYPAMWFKRAGLPRIGETAGFGRPTNNMAFVEASPCTLRHCGEPTTEKLISHFVDVM